MTIPYTLGPSDLRAQRELSQEEVEQIESAHDRARGLYVSHQGIHHVREEARH